MKLTQIQVQNIGAIEDATIAINKPVNAFYGQPQAGKSTLLHAIVWCGGGEFPADIIRHGADEAFIELTFDTALIRREFYRGKDGTKARALTFIRDGKPVAKPYEEIQKLLNPFQLDQNYFINMKDKAKPAYLLELMGVDTVAIDSQIVCEEQTASSVRKELARIGEPAPVAEPVKAEDPVALQVVRQQTVGAWQAAVNAKAERRRQIDVAMAKRESIQEEAAIFRGGVHNVQEAMKLATAEAEAGAQATLETWFNESASKFQNEADAKIAELNRQIQAIEVQHKQDRDTLRETFAKDRDATKERFAAIRMSHANELATNAEQLAASEKALTDLIIPEPLPEPILDTTDIDARLAKANADAMAYARYQDYVKVRDQRREVKAKLQAKTDAIEALRQQKHDLLKGFAEKSPIQGMTFSDEGDPIFEGTALDLLSTSQQMRLSSALEALYPSGIGISLVDHGESLGKRITELVAYAETNKRTVLTAVVGDKPATETEGIGVWVVENGKVKE